MRLPRDSVLMYSRVLRVEATDRPETEWKGKKFYHDFGPGVSAWALPRGRVVLNLPYDGVLLASRTKRITCER